MLSKKIELKKYLEQIIGSEESEKQVSDILNAFSLLSLKKNDFFVQEGHVCLYFCYIESGILQHAIDLFGEEKTSYLALKNSCTSALKSFKNQTPSRKSIKAISDCKLWVVNLDMFNSLMINNAVFYRFYHNLIESQIYLIDDYRIDLLTLTPEERYKKLLINDPKLLQEVPLHYLASFLGISSRHMSRIRKNIN